MNIQIYDNGGRTFNRYTILFMDYININWECTARTMSATPFYQQGFGELIFTIPGKHLGKRIKFSDLPKECQKLVRIDLSNNKHENY